MNILFLISVELYMSPVETWCHNINYYIPDEGNETKNLSMEQMARIRKLINEILWKYYLLHILFKKNLDRSKVPARAPQRRTR